MSVDVSGINETIRHLRKYEHDLFLALRKEMVLEAQPIVAHVASAFPSVPLSNWHTSGGRVGKARLPAYGSNNLKAKPGTGATRGRGQQVLRIDQMNAGRAAFDSAGSRSTSRFVSNLDKHSNTTSRIGKTRSRVMFRATKTNEPIIDMAVRRIVARLDIETTKRMMAGGSGGHSAPHAGGHGGGLHVVMHLAKQAIGE